MVPDIAQLERRARALLSPEIYDFYAGGSGHESTLRINVKAWRRLWLMPRVLRDVSSVGTTLSLWGTMLRTPVAVAPTAFHRLAPPRGRTGDRGCRRPGGRPVRPLHPLQLPDRGRRRRRGGIRGHLVVPGLRNA
jgi:hypothetical protein